MRTGWVWVAALAILFSAAARSAYCDEPDWKALDKDGVVVDIVTNSDGVRGIRCWILADGAKERIYDLLKDAEFNKRVFTGIEKLDVVRSYEGGEDLEFVIEALFLKFHYVVARKNDAAALRMDWSRLSGDFEYVSGSWIVSDSPVAGKRLVEYDSFIIPVKGIDPNLFVAVFRDQAKSNLRRLQDLLDKAAQQY